MKMTLLTILPILSSILIAVTGSAVEELDIREAAFRYQFVERTDGLKTIETYCLSIGANGNEKNPDDAFMKRFEESTPAVKMVSACNKSGFGVTDKATGKPGVIIRTEGIKWISETDVEVEGGYFYAGNGGSRETYFLKKIDGKWIVQRHLIRSIA